MRRRKKKKKKAHGRARGKKAPEGVRHSAQLVKEATVLVSVVGGQSWGGSCLGWIGRRRMNASKYG